MEFPGRRSTDVAAFVSRCPDLFREKTLGVVAMGGVRAVDPETPPPDGGGPRACARLAPDPDASNNVADGAQNEIFGIQSG